MVDNVSLMVSHIGLFKWAYSGIVADIITAVIILLVGLVLGKLAQKLIERVLSEIELDKIVGQFVKLPIAQWAGAFVAYFIYFVAVLTALNQLGLAMTVLYLLAGAVLLVLLISFTLGVKDFIPNAIAGIVIARNRIIKVGDNITVKGVTGKVTSIRMTQICLVTAKKDTIYIPNIILTKSEITKHKGSRAG